MTKNGESLTTIEDSTNAEKCNRLVANTNYLKEAGTIRCASFLSVSKKQHQYTNGMCSDAYIPLLLYAPLTAPATHAPPAWPHPQTVPQHTEDRCSGRRQRR